MGRIFETQCSYKTACFTFITRPTYARGDVASVRTFAVSLLWYVVILQWHSVIRLLFVLYCRYECLQDAISLLKSRVGLIVLLMSASWTYMSTHSVKIDMSLKDSVATTTATVATTWHKEDYHIHLTHRNQSSWLNILCKICSLFYCSILVAVIHLNTCFKTIVYHTLTVDVMQQSTHRKEKKNNFHQFQSWTPLFLIYVHCVTLIFHLLTLNFRMVLAVMWSNSVPNSIKIKQSVAWVIAI